VDRRWAVLAGVSAALVGLGVAELLSALLRVRVSPVLAVGEAIIEITPGALAERAIDAVGRADKPLLVAGVLLGVLAVSALAGVVATLVQLSRCADHGCAGRGPRRSPR
jgi:hypothetical protein